MRLTSIMTCTVKHWKSILTYVVVPSILCCLLFYFTFFKVTMIQIERNASPAIYQWNSTYLWDMRMADENYFRLAKLLPCRTVEYGVGLPSTDRIDSCIQPPTEEFSIQSTLDAQKWLFNHQNPSSCSKKRFAIIRNVPQSGFGSTMHLITWAFGKALAQGRIAVYDVPGNWMYGACKLINPDCVFLPLSNCSNFSMMTSDRTIYIDANTNQFPEGMPMVFRQHSFIWYRSQLMFYLLRYSQQTLAYVQRKIAESFLPPSLEAHNPYISIYVRRSDKVTSKEMQQSYTLKDYFDLFHNDSIKGDIRTVYLNSEDPTVFTEFRELNQKLANRYRLLTIKTQSNVTFSTISAMSKEARARLLLDFLSDLYIEVHADLHSGTLTSNYCRLVDALRLALGKTRPFYTPENRYVIDA